jgi:hypothetical protein
MGLCDMPCTRHSRLVLRPFSYVSSRRALMCIFLFFHKTKAYVLFLTCKVLYMVLAAFFPHVAHTYVHTWQPLDRPFLASSSSMMQMQTPLSELRMQIQTPFSELSSRTADSNRLIISSQMSTRTYRDDAGGASVSGRRSMTGVREDVMRDLLMFLESTPASRV